jgi:hypothetical protein
MTRGCDSRFTHLVPFVETPTGLLGRVYTSCDDDDDQKDSDQNYSWTELLATRRLVGVHTVE